jgi:hypothetical protein
MPDPVVVVAWGRENNAYKDEMRIYKCKVMTTFEVVTFSIDYFNLSDYFYNLKAKYFS